MHDERARQPDALPHAARELLWKGALVAVEADQIDRGQAPVVLRSAGARPRASRPSSTFCRTVSQGKSAKL